MHTKSFPKDESNRTTWQEVMLTPAEERGEEERARTENLSLLKQCLEDAAGIMKAKSLQPYQSDLVLMAVTLFGKRASHAVYWKDEKCRDKFEKATRRRA
jgi:hypothetical protein